MKLSAVAMLAVAGFATIAQGQQFEAERFPLSGSQTEWFGRRLALDQPWAVVSNPTSQLPTHVYNRTSTGWREVQSFVPDGTTEFGDSIAIDGDWIVVGDPTWDWSGERKGKAFAYKRQGDRWSLAQELQPPGLMWWDMFGKGVAIEGEVLVVSAPGVDSPAEDQGAVFIYELIDDTWTLAHVFRHPPSSSPLALLGWDVAISSDTIVAGAYRANGYEGEAWVFERDDAGWRHTAILADPTPLLGDLFGISVDVSGDAIVVGEIAGQGLPGSLLHKPGSAFVFERSSSGSWDLAQEIEPSDGWGSSSGSDDFGVAVAIENKRVVVGATYALTAGPNNGAIYLFEPTDSGQWPHHETERYVVSNPHFVPWGVGLGYQDVDIADGFILAAAGAAQSAFVFELELGQPYCDPAPNSTGEPAHLAAVGSSTERIVLSIRDAPPSTVGAFLISPNRDVQAFQRSPLCLGDGLWRLYPIAPTGPGGVAMQELHLSGSPTFMDGTTWYFQYWFEDPFGSAGTFNFSNAVRLTLE